MPQDFWISPLASGLVAAIVTQIGAWWLQKDREQKRKSESAAYHALRLAVALENYAFRCASMIEENQNAYQQPDQEFPDWKTSLPSPPIFPDDSEGWRSIPLGLTSQALGLHNRILETQSVIDAIAEYAPDELSFELTLKFGVLGVEAWDIANRLREAVKMEPANPAFDFPEALKHAVGKAQKAKTDFEASNTFDFAPPAGNNVTT